MCKKASHVIGKLAIKMYKGFFFLGYMFSNLINAVFSYNLKCSLSSHYFSFVCKKKLREEKKITFFLYFSSALYIFAERHGFGEIRSERDLLPSCYE